MLDHQANDASDVSGDKTGVAEPVPATPTGVICPKCQVRNPPDRVTCSQCGAKLLPGRSIRERIGYLLTGLVSATIFVGLTWLFARMEQAETLPPCCTSPLYLGLLALTSLVGGLAMTFGRTPEYEKYVKRAQRHIEAAPEQALADFTQALELAPEKKQADIHKQRGELYSKLGCKETALEDLAAYAASPQARTGAEIVSEITGVDLEPLAGASLEKDIEGLQRELMHEGVLKGVGTCRRCKDAVELDEDRRCVRCGGRVKDARFVKSQDSGAEMAKLRKEFAARRRRRWIWLAVGGVALFGCALFMGMGIWATRMRDGAEEEATATVPVTAVPMTFSESVFSFEVPSDWDRISAQDVDTLLETSLKGIEPGGYDYIGGVYTGGLGDCRGCARIVVMVARDPSLTGTLTDEQYEQVKEATEKRMGSRLISCRRTEVGSMPAVESVHVGASRQTKLWDLIVVPPEPGLAYLVSCCAHEDSYADFEEVFERAIESLRIGRATPEATSPPGLTPELAVDTSDCVLGAVFQADVTVPDNTKIEAGQRFTKTWRIRNTGTCDWDTGYRLTFVDGDQMGGPDWVAVPGTPAGESAETSVELVAPLEPGTYRGYWQICGDETECFGDRVYLQIISVE